MTFAAAERRFYEMAGDEDCACDKGGDACTCLEDAEDARDDAAIDAEQAHREAIEDDGPGTWWEP